MRSSLVLVLMAVILVPAALLAMLGIRAFRSESERARAGLRERAEQAADAVRAALVEELRALPEEGGASLALRFDADARLLEPRLERVHSLEPRGPEDAALFRFLEAEVARLEAAGDRGTLTRRLTEVGERDGQPWLAAWAWSTLGAIEQHAGHPDEARSAWEELVRRYPGVRDERGLVRAFVARDFLAEVATDPAAARIALLDDVIQDHVLPGEHAVEAFKQALMKRLAGADALRLAELLELDAGRGRVRRLHTAWREGIADWIASGAPGASARFGDWFVTAGAWPDDAGPEGTAGALEVPPLVEAALARPTIVTFSALGFRPLIQGGGLADLAVAGAAPLAERDLAAPFTGLTLSVVADDMEALLASEQRGFRLTAALVALVVLFSLGAAFATVRAIGREVEAARGRDAFMAAVTHELKSPLASIRLLGEVLGEGGVEEQKVREFGQRTAAEAERLSGVISSVLALARLEHEGGRDLDRELLDLRQVAAEAHASFEPLAREGGFELELRVPPEPVFARADGATLSSALIELLDNARKYSDVPHPIEIEVGARGDLATLAVLDRGRGVRATQAETIFAPFRRLGDELTRDRPGVGLGLALVRRIARAHGGDARWEPRTGGGSRFTIELPLSGNPT